MKTFFKKSILPIIIGILFVSTLVAFLYTAVANRSIILRSKGIYLKDDCHFESFDKLVCSYISLTDRNRYFFDLKNVEVSITYKDFFTKEAPFHLTVKDINGTVSVENKKKRNSKFTLKPFFYYLQNVSSKLKNINLTISKESRTFYLKEFSFFNKNGKIGTLKPFYLVFYKNKLKFEKINGSYDYSDIHIHNIKIGIDSGKAYARLHISSEGDFYFYSTGNIKSIFYKKFNLEKISYTVSLKGNIFKRSIGKASYRLDSFVYENLYIKGISGKSNFSIEGGVHGKLGLKAELLKIKDFLAFNLLNVSSFSLKKGLYSDNVLIAKKVNFKKKTFSYISSRYMLRYEKKPYIDGKIFYKDFYSFYKLYSKDDKYTLDLDLKKYRISKFFDIFQLKNKYLNNIDGYIYGKYSIDFKSKTGKGEFHGEKLSLFGLDFSDGKINLYSEFKQNKTDINFSLNGKDGNIRGNGYLKKDFLDFNLDYKGLDISNLIFVKKHYLYGVFDGKGRVYGNFRDLKVDLAGLSKYFRYKTIYLSNIGYRFLYSDKKITINAVNRYLSVKTEIGFSPFFFSILAKAKNADLTPFYPYLVSIQPDLFTKIKPERATGIFKFSLKDKKWQISLKVEKGKVFLVPVGDFVNVSLKGFIKKNYPFFNVQFFKKNLEYKNLIFKQIKGIFSLKGYSGTLDMEIKGLNKVDFFDMFSSISFDIKRKNINGDIFSAAKIGNYKTTLNASVTGSLKDIKGILFTEFFLKNKKFSENFSNYHLGIRKGRYILNFYTKNLDFFVNSSLEFLVLNPEGYLEIKDGSVKGNIKAKEVIAYQNKLILFQTNGVNVQMKDTDIYIKNVKFDGMISGKIEEFLYKIPEEYTVVKSSGKIKKQILSEFIQFGTADGYVRYSLFYKGNIFKLKKNIILSLNSDRIRVRSSYIRGLLILKKLSLDIKDSNATVDIFGKVRSVLSGDNYIKITGFYNLLNDQNSFKIESNLLPVRYPGIFDGNVNAELKTYSKKDVKMQVFEGSVAVSGRLKLQKDIQKSFSGSNVSTEKKELEKITLNIKAKTFSPVYVYGKWGNAYAEGTVFIKGTAKKPSINGYINIVYGKINYLKNKYNIDFAKIKIIDNEPYISARLSTVVANTFIYININGNLKNPKLSFTSIPPKSQNEILSILLLKDTPSTFEAIPLFSAIGRLLYMFLPFGTEDETGLFNTGFNVMINPSYNPIYGITASIYARKNLTRRFYIGLSRPIKEVEGINIFGWYEIGANITEKTSVQFKWFENQDKEIQLMFSLPFDF